MLDFFNIDLLLSRHTKKSSTFHRGHGVQKLQKYADRPTSLQNARRYYQQETTGQSNPYPINSFPINADNPVRGAAMIGVFGDRIPTGEHPPKSYSPSLLLIRKRVSYLHPLNH